MKPNLTKCDIVNEYRNVYVQRHQLDITENAWLDLFRKLLSGVCNFTIRKFKWQRRR